MTSLVPFADVLKVLEQLQSSVNIFFERKDIDDDNRRALRLLQRQYSAASEMIIRLQQSSTDYITDGRISVYAATLEENAEAIAEQQRQLENPKLLQIPFKRVRRTKDVLQQCEDDVKEFFDFLSSQDIESLKTGHAAEPAEYMARCNVPHNPLRLTLDYNSTRCEGQLKAAVLDESGDMVVAVVASGQGGVGKTCALRGLATDRDIQHRFSGGILYIQLGHESNIHTIIQGIRGAVACTGGGERLARKLAKLNTLPETVDESYHWFEPHACLFLIDDIWWVNDIDSEVFTIMRTMLNSESRLVYTSRDKRFLHRTDRLIEFNVKEARGELARRMLMTHAGFDLDVELVGKNKGAFEAILGICQGLPLALGITGASVLLISRMKRPNEKQNAWSDFHEDILSGRMDILDEPVKEYGTLSKIVDTSLRVLQSQNTGAKYAEWFRALCVLRKKQSVPLHTLQRLWDLKRLDEAEKVAYTLFDVSVVQVWRDTKGICMELHDLVLDIAIRHASEKKETQKFFQTLVRNYVPGTHSSGVEEQGAAGGSTEQPAITSKRRKLTLFKRGKRPRLFSFRRDKTAEGNGKSETLEETYEQHVGFEAWWDTEDDGYLHDNLCRLLLHAGYYDMLLGLLSRPQWIVKRLTEGGIYQVEQDIDYGREAMRLRESSEAYVMYHLDMVYLDMIAKAARMSWRAVSENPYEAWFRLYGHLVRYARRCGRTRRFIDDIERYAPRPWAKPSVGFLLPAEAAVIEILSSGFVYSVSMNDDEVCYVSHYGPLEITHYNTRTGLQKKQELFHGPAAEFCSCFAISANGNRVVCGLLDGRVRIWDGRSGRVVGHSLLGHNDKVTCVAVSGDGSRVVSGSADKMVRILDGRSGEAIGLVHHTDMVTCVAMSGDGNRVVSGSWDTVRVRDLRNGNELEDILISHNSFVTCVAVSGDGSRVVSVPNDYTVRIWDGRSGEAVGKALVGHTNAVECVAVSRDGSRVVSGSRDKTVRIWDGRSGEAVGDALVGHTDGVRCVAVSSDGSRVVSGSFDKTVRIWDGRRGEAVGDALVGHTDRVRCVALSGDRSRVVSGSYDGTARIWDCRSGEAVQEALVGHSDSMECVAVSHDGSRVVSGSRDKTVRIWDGRSGEAVGDALVGHTDMVRCVAVSGDGSRAVSGSFDKTVRIWDGRRGEAVGDSLVGHTDRVRCVAVSLDGSRVVSGSFDKTVRIWDGRSGEAVVDALVGHNDRVTCVAVSGDGFRVVSGSADKTVRIWDGRCGGIVAILNHGAVVGQVAVNVDGGRVVTITRRRGKLWAGTECVMTSDDAEWGSTLRDPHLSWSSHLFGLVSHLMERRHDGTLLRLATFNPDFMTRIEGTDLCFSNHFSAYCKIIRG